MDLSCLGIPADDESVYRYFLCHPGRPLCSLKDDLDLDAASIDRAVTRLTELSLLMPGDGTQVLPTEPSAALERLIEERLQRLNQELRAVMAARMAIESLRRDYCEGMRTRNALDIERVEGTHRIRQRIDDLSFFAHEETLSLQPGGPLAEGNVEAARPLDMRLLRRGVTLRCVYHETALKDPAVHDYLRHLVSLGCEVGVIEEPVDRLLIYDRTVVVVPADPRQAEQAALLVREPGLVTQMVTYFHRVWDSARRLSKDERSADPNISDLDREVLATLATAEKDAVAARRLQISVRTFRRHVADLMDRLGAANRFQAGFLAKEQGWL